MTPKRRATILYYTALAVCAVGGVIVAIGWQRSNVLFAVGATFIAAYVVLGIAFLAASRCPHCRRFIDLRGGSAYCPRCGHWIPAREGEPIRRAHSDRT